MPKRGEMISGRYEVFEFLGHGGQGSVWSAMDRASEIEEATKDDYSTIFQTPPKTSGGNVIFHIDERFALVHFDSAKKPDCAIKFLDKPDKKAIERLKLDYKAVRALNDPRIIKYFDFDIPKDGSEYDKPWIIMELIDGSDLQRQAKAGDFRFKLIDSLTLFRDIVDAVGIAHSNKPPIIHRDLKPANILLRDNGIPVISDFGICSIIDDTHVSLTSMDEEVGARNYIAPELRGGIQGEPSPQSDIYSLGKILYCMLSGGIVMDREEFENSNYDLRHINGSPEQMSYVYKRLFPKSICHNIKDRFASIKDFVSEINGVKALIEEHYYPVRPDMKCRFCGEGRYLGQMNLKEKDDWLFICDTCGNAQRFYSPRFRQELLAR